MCKKKPPVPGQENYYHPDTARGLAKITAFGTCFISFIQILVYVLITGYFDAIGLADESILIAAACAIIIGVTLICAIGAKSICLCLPYMFLVPCLCFFYVFKGVMGIYNFIELLESNTNPLPGPLPPGPKGPDDIDYETDPPGQGLVINQNQSAQGVADVADDVLIGGVTSLVGDVTADPPRPMSKTQGIVLLVAILNLLLAVLYVWFVLNVAKLMGRMNDEAEKAKESQKEKKEAEAVEHEREAAEAREIEREIAHEAAQEELISLKNSNSGGPAGQFHYFPLGSQGGGSQEVGQEGHQGDMSHLGHSGPSRYLGHSGQTRYLGHSGGHEGHDEHHQNRYLDHHDRYLGHQQHHHDNHDNRYLGHSGGHQGHGHHGGHQNEHHDHDHNNTNHHTQHHH